VASDPTLLHTNLGHWPRKRTNAKVTRNFTCFQLDDVWWSSMFCGKTTQTCWFMNFSTLYCVIVTLKLWCGCLFVRVLDQGSISWEILSHFSSRALFTTLVMINSVGICIVCDLLFTSLHCGPHHTPSCMKLTCRFGCTWIFNHSLVQFSFFHF
jgi:hypothetical protein